VDLKSDACLRIGQEGALGDSISSEDCNGYMYPSSAAQSSTLPTLVRT